MIVAVTGATGFVGRHIVQELTSRGHRVRGLVREPTRASLPPALELVRGDLAQEGTVHTLVTGVDAVVHLVGIIVERGAATFAAVHVEGTRAIVAAARAAGVRRFAHMSALGARDSAGATAYHRTKARAEAIVRDSGVPAALFQPSFIAGPENVPIRMLARLHRFLPAVPVFGDGTFPLQPVWVGDVARAFSLAIERADLVGEGGKSYELGGPDRVTYAEFVRAIGRACGHPRPLAHLPLGLMRVAARAFDLLPGGAAPLTSDQLQMLVEGSVPRANAIESVFGIRPVSLDESLRRSVGSA